MNDELHLESVLGQVNTSDTPLTPEPAPRKKARRGFAAMSLAQRRKIASRGGKAAHAKGTAWEWTSEQARAAGIKGGATTQARIRQAREEAARLTQREER